MASPSAPRLRYNNIGSTGGNPITFSTGGTTTGTWSSDPGFPTIASPNYAVVVVDPGTANEEITYLTAFTAAGTSGTFTRAQEGTSGVSHSSKPWAHAATALDWGLNYDDGSTNVSIGSGAGPSTGSNDVCVGYQAGHADTTGTSVFVGYQAGSATTTAGRAVYIGYQAGNAEVDTGANNGNILIGYQTTIGAAAAADNVIIGTSATSGGGTSNVVVGFNASAGAASTLGNTVIGKGAAAGNASNAPSSSVVIGQGTGNTAMTGTGNTVVGAGAATGITSGASTMVGFQAGQTSTAGNKTTTGSHQTCIGYNSGQASSTQRDYITCLGEGTTCGAAGTVAIGIDNAATAATTSTANEIRLGSALQTTNVSALKGTIATKTTTYAMNAYDFMILGNHATVAFTVTLPAPTAGAIYIIKNINAAAVTVSQHASENIDGAGTLVLTTQYESVMLSSDGANWFVMAANAGAIV